MDMFVWRKGDGEMGHGLSDPGIELLNGAKLVCEFVWGSTAHIGEEDGVLLGLLLFVRIKDVEAEVERI